jgi:hypothetical protein
MTAGIINASQIADGSCMKPIRFLGGECEHYEGCIYRRSDTGCNATSARLARLRAELAALEEQHRLEGESPIARVRPL